MPDNPVNGNLKPVFIGGCDRSGTTFLGAILGAHPSILCVPEAQFKFDLLRLFPPSPKDLDTAKVAGFLTQNWRFALWDIPGDIESGLQASGVRDIASILRWLSMRYGEKIGKTNVRLWVDHTPSNFRYIISLLDHFPDARFIHIVRDGRGVASSFFGLDWGPNTPVEAAHFWLEKIAYGLAAERAYSPECVMRVRYEDLLLDMDDTLNRLCLFLGIEMRDEMKEAFGFRPHRYTLAHHRLVGMRPDSSKAMAWRSSLSSREVEIFESIAGDVLRCLSYVPNFGEGHALRAEGSDV